MFDRTSAAVRQFADMQELLSPPGAARRKLAFFRPG
jgi:hypothetical protein